MRSKGSLIRSRHPKAATCDQVTLRLARHTAVHGALKVPAVRMRRATPSSVSCTSAVRTVLELRLASRPVAHAERGLDPLEGLVSAGQKSLPCGGCAHGAGHGQGQHAAVLGTRSVIPRRKSPLRKPPGPAATEGHARPPEETGLAPAQSPH